MYAKKIFIHLIRFQLPLQFVFIVPFLLEILLAVGIVSYMSFKNGQKTVDNLVNKLI